MDRFFHFAAIVIGLAGLFVYFRSVIRVMLLNWRERDIISRSVCFLAVDVVQRFAGNKNEYARNQRVLAWILPIFIILSVVCWFLLVQIAFTFILWGVGAEPSWPNAFTASGSALSTLGFKTPPTLHGELLAIFEGAMGLAIVVLLFSFVPGYLAAIQARERKVGWLYARTGRHPTCVTLFDALELADRIEDTSIWEDWEQWFRGIYETHATAPILSHVPSIYRGTNWVGASAAVLDAASLLMSTLDAKHTRAAAMCRHTGVATLTLVSGELRGAPPVLRSTSSLDPRMAAAFDHLYDRLAASNLPVDRDKDKCREAFVSLRAEYEPHLIHVSKATLMPIDEPSISQSSENVKDQARA